MLLDDHLFLQVKNKSNNVIEKPKISSSSSCTFFWTLGVWPIHQRVNPMPLDVVSWPSNIKVSTSSRMSSSVRPFSFCILISRSRKASFCFYKNCTTYKLWILTPSPLSASPSSSATFFFWVITFLVKSLVSFTSLSNSYPSPVPYQTGFSHNQGNLKPFSNVV